MPGIKTNERPGTRAVLRHGGLSASKARQVLNLIRGADVDRAAEILNGVEREAAEVIGKVLTSAVANAAHNDHQNPEELYVSACYADEGATLKRWRPRARGRATRIRKRTCHITIVVSRLPEDRLERRRTRAEALSANRSRRVETSRKRADQTGRASRRAAAAEARAEAEAAEAEAADIDGLVEDDDVTSDVEEIETTAATEESVEDEGVEEQADEATEVVDEAADTEAEADTEEKGK